MPRPALRKRGSHSKSPRRRAGQKSPPSTTIALQQLERRVGHKAVGERPDNSDDSDRLVTRSHSKSRNNSPRGEVYSSGAIAKGDKPGAYPTRAQRRRHLERDTQQVIKENKERESRRSASVPASEQAASSQSSPGSGTRGRSQADDGVSVRRSQTKSPQVSQLKPQQTPAAESSILGTLKPRKRQASILHAIDNNDSSIITPEDEEQFLPDAVSTPYHSNKNADVSVNDSQPLQTSARKRKRVSDEQAQFARQLQEPSLQSQSSIRIRDSRPPSGEPSLPPQKKQPSSSVKKSRPSDITPGELDEEIMAPPQSSSPEPSPELVPAVNNANPSKSSVLVPSTQDLQSHMPTRRKDKIRAKSGANHFDIPEDSASDPVDDDSVFVPNKKARKAQKKDDKPTAKALSGKTTSKARSKAPGATTTSTTPATPRPSTIRTPLPLSRSVNAENRKLRTPIQTAMTGKSITTKGKPQSLNSKLNHALSSAKKNKSLTDTDHNTKRGPQSKQNQSGGASHTPTQPSRITRSSRRTGIPTDGKENRAPSIPLSPGLTSTTTTTVDDMDLSADDHIYPTVELDAATTTPGPKSVRKAQATTNRVGKSTTRSPAMPRSVNKYGSARKRGQRQTSATAVAAAATTWANQWAGIDDYCLDFEEVSGSVESDSPIAR